MRFCFRQPNIGRNKQNTIRCSKTSRRNSYGWCFSKNVPVCISQRKRDESMKCEQKTRNSRSNGAAEVDGPLAWVCSVDEAYWACVEINAGIYFTHEGRIHVHNAFCFAIQSAEPKLFRASACFYSIFCFAFIISKPPFKYDKCYSFVATRISRWSGARICCWQQWKYAFRF